MGKADKAKVARRIKALRAVFKVTQTDLAALCGLTPGAVGNWESGVSRPTLDQAEKLCARYRVTMDYLFLGDLSTLPHSLACELEEAERRI